MQVLINCNAQGVPYAPAPPLHTILGSYGEMPEYYRAFQCLVQNRTGKNLPTREAKCDTSFELTCFASCIPLLAFPLHLLY